MVRSYRDEYGRYGEEDVDDGRCWNVSSRSDSKKFKKTRKREEDSIE